MVQNQDGKLYLHFDNVKSKSSLEPSIEMEIESYLITGSGPDGRSISPVSSTGEDVTIDNLFNGNWDITVQGLNSDGTPIGEGTQSVEIIANTTTSTSILVEEFSGEGTLTLEINWPYQDLKDPNIDAHVISEKDNTNTNLEFSINSETGEASYSGNLDSGYYTLYIGLYDGDTDDLNNKLIGKIYSLRIVKGNETSYIFEATSDDLNVYGSLTVTVSSDIEKTFDVTLSSNQKSLYEGFSDTLTATPSDDGEYTYSWYLDGIKESETSFQYNIPKTLTLGRHNIDVICSKNEMNSSASCIINIEEHPENFIKINILTKDTSNIEKEFLLTYGLSNIEQLFISNNDTSLLSASSLEANLINYDNNNYLNNKFIIEPFNQDINGQDYTGSYPEFPNDFSIMQLTIDNEEGRNLIYNNENQINFISKGSFNNYTGLFFYSDDCNSKYITVNNIGNIGEFVNGNITLKDMPIYNIYDYKDPANEILIGNYDIEIYFNIKRGNDITISEINLNKNLEDSSYNRNYIMLLDDEFIFDEDKSFSDSDHTQTSWNTESDGSGTSYEIGSIYTVTDSDITFYAIWEENT
jgi:hypothetical protein